MKLEDQLKRKLRQVGHKYNTEKAYVQKYRQFVQHARMQYGEFRHPAQLGRRDIESFMTHLAADRLNTSSTQSVALSALKFLYEQVLEMDLGDLEFVCGEKSKKLPVVMTFQETEAVLREFKGLYLIQSNLMYGCGT